MRALFAVPALSVLLSCGKGENTPAPPPVALADTALKISALTPSDVNAVDVTCRVSPGAGEAYMDAWLHWSTAPDFATGSDSQQLSGILRTPLEKVVPLSDLKPATTYYFRVGATYNRTRFFSPVKSWTSDTLAITRVTNNPGPFLSPGERTVLTTNLAYRLNSVSVGAQLFLGTYPCPVEADNGSIITFHVPATIPPGMYRLELRRKGLTTTFREPVEVLRGRWEALTPPPLPLNTTAGSSGLTDYGTAYSSDRGWLVGGSIHNVAPGEPEGSFNGSLYEFNPQGQTWTRRQPTNRRYINYPLAHYYNNSIYVIGGMETTLSPVGGYQERYETLKRVKRLDLGSLTWHDADSLPYRNYSNMASFAYNNEFYIGMGLNGDSVNQCCGMPLPSKNFWKYSPATDRWTKLADFPGSYQRNPTLFTIGTKAYAYLGAIPTGDPLYSTTFFQELWEYDIPANTWRRLPLPEGSLLPGEKCAVIVHNGKACFLTAQVRATFYNGYGYMLQSIFLEWNPATNTFRRIGYPSKGTILQPVHQSGNRFYFQSDALGYVSELPNITYALTLE